MEQIYATALQEWHHTYVQFIVDHLVCSWNWYIPILRWKLSYNIPTFLGIGMALSRGWNWNAVTSNPNITLDIAIDNPDYPWDWNQFDGVSHMDVHFIGGVYDYDDLPTLVKNLQIAHSD